MSTCSCCLWWAKETAFNNDAAGMRECLRRDLPVAPMAEPGATWGLGTAIATGPSFGCAFFQPKQAEMKLLTDQRNGERYSMQEVYDYKFDGSIDIYRWVMPFDSLLQLNSSKIVEWFEFEIRHIRGEATFPGHIHGEV